MGLSLQLSFVFLFGAVILAILRIFIKDANLRRGTDSFITLVVIAQIFMLIVAIGTRDPIFESITPEAQLIIAGLSAAFAIWKAYLDPMKKRIGKLEVGQGEIKTDISYIKADIHLIKEKLLKS